jgi:hypothetical protein
VPAEERRDEIRGPEGVDGARQHRTGEPVRDGQVPGDLGLVDGEVRRDGAVAALVGEDVVAGGLRGGCGGGRSTTTVRLV